MGLFLRNIIDKLCIWLVDIHCKRNDIKYAVLVDNSCFRSVTVDCDEISRAYRSLEAMFNANDFTKSPLFKSVMLNKLTGSLSSVPYFIIEYGTSKSEVYVSALTSSVYIYSEPLNVLRSLILYPDVIKMLRFNNYYFDSNIVNVTFRGTDYKVYSDTLVIEGSRICTDKSISKAVLSKTRISSSK